MEHSNKPAKPDIKHWLSQTLPPLLILSILFTTTNGTSLVFLSGIFVIPVLISLISLLIKVFKYKERKHFMLRPALTILFFFIVLSIAQWSYKIALEDAVNAARIIQEECNQFSSCPNNPKGWDVDRSRISRNDLGIWFKYQANYQYKPNSFNIRVYQGPDIGDNITGGVNLPFTVSRYKEST